LQRITRNFSCGRGEIQGCIDGQRRIATMQHVRRIDARSLFNSSGKIEQDEKPCAEEKRAGRKALL
jgi:hypothetical protein